MSQLLALFGVLRELLLLGVKVLALYREAKKKQWIEEGEFLGEAIKNAKTDRDRADLARRLFDRRVL